MSTERRPAARRHDPSGSSSRRGARSLPTRFGGAVQWVRSVDPALAAKTLVGRPADDRLADQPAGRCTGSVRPEDRQRARRLHPGGSNNNQRGDGLAQGDHSLERALSAKTVVGRLAVAGLGTDPLVPSLKQRLWGRLSGHTRPGAQYPPPGRLTGRGHRVPDPMR